MQAKCVMKKGRLSLGSLGICLVPDQVVDIPDMSVYEVDVRHAIDSGLLELEKDVPKNGFVVIKNVSNGIMSFGSLNVSLQPDEAILAPKSSLEQEDVSQAATMGIIEVVEKAGEIDAYEDEAKKAIEAQERTYAIAEIDEPVEEPEPEPAPEPEEPKQEEVKAEVKKPKRKTAKKKTAKKKTTSRARKGGRKPKKKETSAFGDSEELKEALNS